MAMTWEEVTKDPQYKTLSLEEKKQWRKEYFQEVIIPWAKENKHNVNEIWKEFRFDTEEIDPSLRSKDVLEEISSDPLSQLKAGFSEGATGMWGGMKHEAPTPRGFVERISRQLGTLGSDFPWMIAGGLIGGTGGPVTAAGGAFALPEAMKRVMQLKQERGEVKSSEELLERLGETLYAAEKGYAIGALTRKVGGKLPKALKIPGEIGTMVTTGAALEGKAPTTMDFFDAAILVGGLHGAGKVVGKIMSIHEKTGKHPMDIAEELIAEKKPEVKKEIKQPTKEKIDYNKQVIENYRTEQYFSEFAPTGLPIEKIETKVEPPTKKIDKTSPEYLNNSQQSAIENIKIALKKEESDFHTKPIFEAVLGDEKLKRYATGDPFKVVRIEEKFNRPSMPLFEAEAKIMLKAKNLTSVKWFENPIRTFEELGGGIKRLFYDRIKYSEHNAKIEQAQTKNEFHEVLKNARKTGGVTPQSPNRIGVFAIAKQEGGVKILSEMGKIPERYKGIIEGTEQLTAGEQILYDWFRNKYKEHYYRLNAARSLAGVKPFGEVNDYFTFIRNTNLMQDFGYDPAQIRKVDIRKNIDKLDTPKMYYMHPRTTFFGFAKERTMESGKIPVEIDAFKIFSKYMTQSIDHIHKSPAIAKGRMLLLKMNNATLEKMGMKPKEDGYMLATQKPLTHTFLSEWLDTVSGKSEPTPTYRVTPGVRKVLQRLNKNLAYSILSFNLRSALIQPSAFVNSISWLGPKYAKAGVMGIFKSGEREFAKKYSRVLTGREYDITVRGAMENIQRLGEIKERPTSVLGISRDVLAKWGILPLQKLDVLTAQATWIGAYKLGKEKLKMNFRDAVEYADDVVNRTQGSGQLSDIARVQRNVMLRTATLFQTFVINNWGFLTKDILGIKNPNAKPTMERIGKIATWIAGATLMNILYEDILGFPSPFPAPINAYTEAKERGYSPQVSAWLAMLEGMDLVPAIGGAYRYGSHVLGPTPELAQKTVEFVRHPERTKVPDITEWAGKVAGIPGTVQIKKMLREKKKKKSPIGKL